MGRGRGGYGRGGSNGKYNGYWLETQWLMYQFFKFVKINGNEFHLLICFWKVEGKAFWDFEITLSYKNTQ